MPEGRRTSVWESVELHFLVWLDHVSHLVGGVSNILRVHAIFMNYSTYACIP